MLIAYAGRPTVTLNGNKVSGWTFDQNNVLSFELQAGYSAWLQFTVLPGGALFMGTMAPSNAEGYVSDKEFQVRSIFLHGPSSLLTAGCLLPPAVQRKDYAMHRDIHLLKSAQVYLSCLACLVVATDSLSGSLPAPPLHHAAAAEHCSQMLKPSQ